jgi:hypothetical protein
MTIQGCDDRVGTARPLARRVGLLAVAVLLFLAAPATAQPGSRVDWKDGRLSVRAEETPLADVLAEIARQTGVQILGAEDLRESLTLGFSNVALEDGLRRLLAGLSYVIVEPAAPQGKARPTEIWLLGRGRTGPGAVGATGGGDRGRDVGPLTAASDATAEHPPGARLRSFLADPDPGIRRFAVERLGEVGEPWAFSRLVAALHDESAGVREKAVTALGEYGPEAVDPVMMLLQTETGLEVRVAAAELLGRFGGPPGVGLLEGMLVDSDPRLRRTAAQALARTGGAEASQALRTAALDQDATVRTAALDGLGIFGAETDPTAAIEDALARDDDAVRAAAAALVGPLGQLGFLEVPSQATAGDGSGHPIGFPSEPR